MPIRKVAGGWKWGNQGPFPTREKAAEVARAAYAHGYREGGKKKGKRGKSR